MVVVTVISAGVREIVVLVDGERELKGGIDGGAWGTWGACASGIRESGGFDGPRATIGARIC